MKETIKKRTRQLFQMTPRQVRAVWDDLQVEIRKEKRIRDILKIEFKEVKDERD